MVSFQSETMDRKKIISVNLYVQVTISKKTE